MYKGYYLWMIVFLAVNLQIGAQSEFEIINEETYDEGALYGYMNGGSELYLEYGFQSLTVKEIKIEGESLTVEIFTMPDEVRAYGIFSINVFKCSGCSEDRGNICCSSYQLQLVVGCKYVSIVNTTGSEKAQKAAWSLYKKMMDTEDGSLYVLPDVIEILKPRNVFVVNGVLAIENRAAYWASCYKEISPGLCHILKWGTSAVSAMVIKGQLQKKDWHMNEQGFGYEQTSKNGYTFLFRYEESKKEEVEALLKLLL